MKKHNIIILSIITIIFLTISPVTYSADTQRITILTASENIEYISQQIAKAYFYKQQRVRVSHATRELKEGMNALNTDLVLLEKGNLDEEGKNILSFLSFTHDDLKETLSQPYSEENGALMIDYSESLLEGAELIAQKHHNKKDSKERMIVVTERMLFLLERITKYYIAFRAGFNDQNNIVQIEHAIAEFEVNLAKINKYKSYPKSLKSTIMKINDFWPIAKRFYLGVEKGALPVIVLASTDKLVKRIQILGTHHRGTLTENKG